MIKLLLGGSPCTYWSIAQKNNRETEPSGLGWELFENYLIAKEKFKPDIFLYENNKSAAQAIKDEIKKRLNVWDGTFLTQDSGARYIEINSALVSAQNRQRFYVHNCGDVQQPKDRGILLRDILETGTDLSQNEKSYCLTATYGGATAFNTLERSQRTMVAEPVGTTKDEKAYVLTANYAQGSGKNIGNYAAHTLEKGCKTMVAEPVCVQEQVFGRKAGDDGLYDRRFEARTDGKSGSLTATNRQNAIAEPVRILEYSTEKARPLTASYANKGAGEGSLTSECFPNNHNKQVFDYIAEPVRIGTIENDAKNSDYDSKQYRVYSPDGKSTTICGQGGGVGAKTGLYACPINTTKDGKSQTIKAQYSQTGVVNICCYTSTYGASGVAIPTEEKPVLFTGEGKDKESMRRVYEVKDGKITIKDKQYPIKLKDGFYIIRKLTVTECCRLQTMPDFYMSARIEKVKEIVLKCKDVPTQIVAIPLRTEKRGCAINTTFDLKEMEVQNLKDQNLTRHCLALSRGVIDIDKHTWDIVLCTIKDLQEKEPQDWLEAIMNMCGVTTSTDLNIEKLPKECWGENLKKEKSSTILTLIKKIIAKITSMFVPQKNTRVYIENCAENCLSTSPTSLTLGISYSTEKNMRLVSESACYKGLGNGWTAEVIIHILSHALKNVPKDEKIVVLSMYDGIGTGRYCLDKMGFTNVKYYSYEIDKYAKQIAMSNYPDIVQCGDAYKVRNEDWSVGK